MQRLEDYIEKHERGQITAIRKDTDNTDDTIDDRMTMTRKQKWEEKQLYGRFELLINTISHQKTWTWLRKGNRISPNSSTKQRHKNQSYQSENRQDSTKCGDRDETINHIISECCKLVQKEYKTWHDWVGKVIPWEMCRTCKFDHTNKWYMYNPAPVQEKDTDS